MCIRDRLLVYHNIFKSLWQNHISRRDILAALTAASHYTDISHCIFDIMVIQYYYIKFVVSLEVHMTLKNKLGIDNSAEPQRYIFPSLFSSKISIFPLVSFTRPSFWNCFNSLVTTSLAVPTSPVSYTHLQLCWHHSFPNPCASSRSVYQREIDPRHWYGFVTHRL